MSLLPGNEKPGFLPESEDDPDKACYKTYGERNEINLEV